MALMIPENVQDFKTDGERNFYRFLEGIAKPHDQYLAWYSPDFTEHPDNDKDDEQNGAGRNTEAVFLRINRTCCEDSRFAEARFSVSGHPCRRKSSERPAITWTV